MHIQERVVGQYNGVLLFASLFEITSGNVSGKNDTLSVLKVVL